MSHPRLFPRREIFAPALAAAAALALPAAAQDARKGPVAPATVMNRQRRAYLLAALNHLRPALTNLKEAAKYGGTVGGTDKVEEMIAYLNVEVRRTR